ncbi:MULTISPECIES: 3-methyladenine DNA glycosylase [unclassified Corynebacterium]|uniref:3-methyladenine DNA glycosylase n=1 Tax=unclassified Corynebacterium TaxID=2624378 RepID=UPI001CE46906|nr:MULTISPECIES: 3-methyladenine DNA glycosylase [unclassified Corynebacterium]
MTNAAVTEILERDHWHTLQDQHRRRVDELTGDAVARRQQGQRHPVWDFMFSYYPIKPGQLRKWHPGPGTLLRITEADQERLPQHKGFYKQYPTDGGAVWALDTDAVWEKRGQGIRYIHRLVSLTLHRPAQLGCFGLHEWAMVYKDTPRHPEPLRLGAEGTQAVVEAANIKCTHYDAFRFFTEAAAPLNEHQPTRQTQPDFEQPGCLHASMDLYKWAAKLGPLVPGELWLKTFELACDVRQLDMEASPYDLTDWGFSPVKIETPAGRAEYVRRQQALMERGQQLRQELLASVECAFPQLAG